VSAASKRAGVRATDLAARAQWSCSLSGARGLGDRDMVLQLIEHTDLSRPDDATLSELTRICERLRADDAADYAAISTGLLAALGTTPA
jgi:hypothetical protein